MREEIDFGVTSVPEKKQTEETTKLTDSLSS
jgi:hypothetical protein